jgi:hypothetical protein
MLLASLVLSVGQIPSARADDATPKEARIRVVTNWNAGCSGSSRSHWGDMGMAWYDEITDDAIRPFGHGSACYRRSGTQINGSIVDSDFVDPDNQTWGHDDIVADESDALWVGMHGGNDSGDHRWRGSVRVNESGDGNCGTYQGHIELGDDDMEFLVLSSCYSMDYEDWWDEWSSSFDGLHEINGFHGTMYISWIYDNNYREFADDAFRISIADSWIDNLYDRHASGSDDQCPVSRVVGTSQNDCRDRLNSERYDNLMADSPGLGEPRSHRTRYVVGCNPCGMEALP